MPLKSEYASNPIESKLEREEIRTAANFVQEGKIDTPLILPTDKEHDVENMSGLSESRKYVLTGKNGRRKEIDLNEGASTSSKRKTHKGAFYQKIRDATKKAVAETKPDFSIMTEMNDAEIEHAYKQVKHDEFFHDFKLTPHQERMKANLDRKKNSEGGLNQKSRRTAWWNSGADEEVAQDKVEFMADSGAEYDMWQQAYRFLGMYIDCDHKKDGGDRRKLGEDEGEGEGGDDNGCSRWAMWAGYVDPNYEGYGYYEYYGDEPYGKLDCHEEDTEWQLMGVYREEGYQFYEQISKHLWAINEYEYITVLAGLAYMSDSDCYQIGYTDDGDVVYGGVQPLAKGYIQMGVYMDETCLEPYPEEYGINFSQFGLENDLDLGSGDFDDDATANQAYEWWSDAQEYTLENFNDVYDTYKLCTTCMDYPTYQDGYFIGDDGTDEDDLINQCWKFYSHDSFTCEGDCLSMATAQGSILGVNYGAAFFGSGSISGAQTEQAYAETSFDESPPNSWQKAKADIYVACCGLVFVATFLAFAVARGKKPDDAVSSRHGGRSPRSKSEKLLDKKSRRRSKSKSRARSSEKERRHHSSSRDRSSSPDKSSRSKKYVPPPDPGSPPKSSDHHSRRSKSSSRKKSSRHDSHRSESDDFVKQSSKRSHKGSKPRKERQIRETESSDHHEML